MSLSHRLDAISLGKIVLVRERLMDAARRGQTVWRLESGDPSFDVQPHVLDAMAAAARAGKTHYGPTCGIPELRAAARRKLADVNGIALPGDDAVFVTNGAMHALFVAFAALLEPGDEVLLPDPMWTEVAENVRLAEGVPVGVPLHEADGYAYEARAIEARVTRRTKAIYLNTPHNPTGAVLSREQQLALLDVAARRGLWIVSDEAYEDVVFAPARHWSIAALAQETYGVDSDVARRCVSIFSFSKSHAMSGLRVGLVATSDPVLRDRLPKVIRCTINNVNSLAQWGAVAALEGPRDHLAAMRDEYLVRRDMLLDALSGIAEVRAFVPQGGFMCWAALDPSLYARLGVTDADALSDRLADLGIGSAPGSAFAVESSSTHCRDALRLSFSCATPMVRDGAAALRAALGGAPAATLPPHGEVRLPGAVRAVATSVVPEMAASMLASAPLADVVRRPVARPTPVPRRTAPPHWQPRGFEVL
ncbi:MAG TPA: aminotransferase class I/II-fold pyridoxal phosphate-dependent enzyme [Gemmatirosa sp.]|nr:aminotransferase class I/II-fold pyridoxal phosphate-dependent enzyme [Gemmatirosa sp.]